MATFQIISAYDAKQSMGAQGVKLVDIRDEQSYETDHVEDSFHLTNANVGQFMKEISFDTKVFVLCYHGNSSKGVAQYLCDQGYNDVYSVEGGFASWRIVHPHE